MIESLLFVIALTLSISGVYILKKFADNEHDKDFVMVHYRDWETDRKSTRLNSSHSGESRMPSSA